MPTPGFGVEKFKKNKINFMVFDMSGQSKYRTLWEKYYFEAEVIPLHDTRLLSSLLIQVINSEYQ